MNRDAIEPISIQINSEDKIMTIQWQDGHESLYLLDEIRAQCPCAVCRDHRRRLQESQGLTMLPERIALASSEVEEVREVGRYAIQFIWKDGHNTGFYTFDFLRSLCPCNACQARSASSA